MIQIEKLSKEFVQDGKRVVALDGIDLEVPHGEICVLLGPSGCGKTTTLKIINRLVTPIRRARARRRPGHEPVRRRSSCGERSAT